MENTPNPADAPEGYTLRLVAPASPASRARRPASEWLYLLEEGIERHGLGWGPLSKPTGAEPSSLASRGALAIAERNSSRVYRVTPAGAALVAALSRRPELRAKASELTA